MRESHSFKKQFGQNFLRKESRFPGILVSALDPKPEDVVIEIGPGDGVVTKKLLDLGAKVLCIEIDYDLLPRLISKFGENENFQIANENILYIDLKKEISKYYPDCRNFKVIGSLPYNISKQIINKFLLFQFENEDYRIEKLAFIIQDEVAKDYTAKAPSASFLSNYISLFAHCKKLESIPASQFIPKPKVDGGIIAITPLNLELQKSNYKLHKFLKVGFVSPRKTLINNLASLPKLDKQALLSAFSENSIPEKIRPAELSLDSWSKLYSSLAYLL